jgi:hypothetical protein
VRRPSEVVHEVHADGVRIQIEVSEIDLDERNSSMYEKNSVVAIYGTHAQAEEAVKELEKSGCDMKKLSIVGKDYHTDENVVGSITPAIA